MHRSEAENLVERCFAAGRAVFSSVPWEPAGFAAAVKARWNEDYVRLLSRQPAGERALAEEFLVTGLLAGHAAAIEAFDARFIQPLYGKLHRIVPDSQIEDVLQVVREKLLVPPHAALRSYESRGQLGSWVTIVATRCALDARRARGTANRLILPLDDELVQQLLGPEEQYSSRQLQLALTHALRDAVRSLPREHRLALRMQALGNWNIDQIGRAFSTHRATAARWLAAARRQIEAEVYARMQDRFGLAGSDVNRLLQQFRSQLDLRLSQMFPTDELPAG